MDVTNEDFLYAIFGAEAGRAHVTGFEEDPGKLEALGKRHYWGGGRYSWWRKESLRDPFNSYFAISLFRDDPRDGKAHRKAELHEATYAIVLDDVGTKADASSLGVLPHPSWVLETSPGNFQWGFILREPERDYGRAKALIEGLVARGLSDPATTDVTRYARLPEGRNTKASCGPSGFRCELHARPHLSCYVKLEEIASPLWIVLPEPGTVVRRSSRPVHGMKDHLLTLLEDWGMVHGPASGEGWWDVECPWAAEHTDRADSGTAYRPGGGGDSGAFKCQHGHCAGRRRRDLARWAEDRAQEESGGLLHLDEWSFDEIEGWEPAHPFRGEHANQTACPGLIDLDADRVFGKEGEPDTAFFRDHVLVKSEDAYLYLPGDVWVSRRMLDDDWAARLEPLLPLLNPKAGTRIAPSKWFVDGTQRKRARIADGVTYRPGAPHYFQDEAGAVRVNEWRQPPRPAAVVTGDLDVEPWLRLVRHVTSQDGAEAAELLLDWFALVVGAPDVKPGWHVLVQGGQGLGKDMIVQPVIAGVGAGNVATANAKSLHSDFNGWAARRLVVMNELKQTSKGSASGADQYNALKEIAEHTNAWLTINRKNREPYKARNVAALYATSNDPAPIAVEEDDRRFMVLMAGTAEETPPWPNEEYAALRAWFDGGGLEWCAAWLHARWKGLPASRRAVLTGRAPKTLGKERLARNVEDPVQSWMREQVETGAWPDLMTGSEIAEALAAAARTGVGGFRYTPGAKRWAAQLQALGGERVYRGGVVRLKTGKYGKLWAVRAPRRFDGMSEHVLAQAHKSAAGHAFADKAEVIQLQRNSDTEPDEGSDAEGPDRP